MALFLGFERGSSIFLGFGGGGTNRTARHLGGVFGGGTNRR